MNHTLFCAYCKKLFHTPALYLCILGITLTCMIRNFTENITYNSVVYSLDLLLDLDMYRKIIPFFAAIPFAANFCREYISGITKFCIIRSDNASYILSNFVMGAVSSFVVTFLGLMIYVMILAFRMPLYYSLGNPTAEPYGVFLDGNKPIIYIIIKAVIYSVSVSMWVCSGITFSAFLPSPYIAVCSPFIFSYILEEITLNFSDCLNLWYLSTGRDVLNSTAGITFFYTLFLFILIISVLGKIFSYAVKRRITDETV